MNVSELIDPLAELVSTVEAKVGAVRDLRHELRSEMSLLNHKVNAAFRGTTGELESDAQRQYRVQFREWLAEPRGPAAARLKQAAGDLSRKDVTLATDSAGYALPKVLQEGIYRQAFKTSPHLGAIGIDQVASTDFRQVVSRSDGSGARASELTSRSGTTESTFRLTTPAWAEYYTFATASEHAMSDIPTLEEHLAAEAGSQIGEMLGHDVLYGDGSGKVKGLTATAPAAIGDEGSPERTQEQLEYVPVISSPAAVSLYDLEVMLGKFREEYVNSPDFVILTRWPTWLEMIRGQLTDGQELISQRRPTVWGLPVAHSGLVDANAAGNYPVIAGAWRRGYQLLSRGPIRVTVDEFSTVGFSTFRFRSRFGGCVRDHRALKLVKGV